jgi:hypothetical protein
MPAIDLVRLRQEALQLTELFSNPSAFLRQLYNLLEAYAQPASRRGDGQHSAVTLPTFRVPPAVLKQIHFELQAMAQADPGQALSLADALWAQRSLEHRILAARLLGSAPVIPAKQTLDRLTAWVETNREESLLVELAENGCAHLRQENPSTLIEFAWDCLGSGDIRRQSLALLALRPLLTRTNYANLPALFEILAPIANDPPKRLRPYLTSLLEALSERSPMETLYFLEQSLTENPGEGTRWLARQALKYLPAEGQERLRVALQQASPSEGK